MAELTIEEVQAQVAELTTQLAEAQKGGGDISEEMTRLKAEKAELIEGRDKAKARAREAEDAKLTEQGEFKTLSEQLQAERTLLQEQIEANNATLTVYKERDEAELADLIAKIPETLRESVSELPLVNGLKLARKLIAEKPQGPGSRPAGSPSAATFEEEIRACTTTRELNAVKKKHGHY